MDTSQWPQAQVGGVGGVVDNSMESSKSVIEKRGGVGTIRPQKDQIFYCPRCNSTNTKFCYYNNYSLTQPRYFCKTCRRYWTEGGSLRNVPVGGGSRKNKRSSSTSSPSSSSRNPVPQNPNKFLQGGQDLNLAYPPPNIHDYSISSFSKYIEVPSNFANGKSVLHLENPNPNITSSISSHFPSMELFGSHHQESRGCDINHPNRGAAAISKLVEVPYVFGNDKITPGNPNLSTTTASPYFAPIELFKNGESNDLANTSSKGQVSSLKEPVSDNSGTIMFSSMGFPMQEFKPSVNFSSDEYDNNGGGYGNLHGLQQQQTNGARVLFPFQDNLKQASSGSGEQQFDDQNRGQGDSNTGFWKGMVNGGSW